MKYLMVMMLILTVGMAVNYSRSSLKLTAAWLMIGMLAGTVFVQQLTIDQLRDNNKENKRERPTLLDGTRGKHAGVGSLV